MAKAASSTKRSPATGSGKATKPAAAKAARKPAARAKASARSKSPKSTGNRVAVLGGGISGLTAALKLAKAGFDVTIYEMQERLGGNTSSRLINGIEHDVYPHMFCSWYANFWSLYRNDLGLDPEGFFEPREGSKVLRKGETEFGELLNPTSIEAAIENLKSGVMSPAEMWLLGYAGLDLAAHPFDRSGSKLMEMLSVNGFIYSRGYGTENVAAMENYLLTLIWSIPSSWTAAATYQNFLRHTFTFPNHAPFNYLMKGSLQDGLIAPIEKQLRAAGCTIKVKTEITAVRIDDDERPVIFSRRSIAEHLTHDAKRLEDNPNRTSRDTFDYAVMALPVKPMSDMVMGSPQGRAGTRIVDRLPDLSQMQNLGSVSIPVVDLYLKRKLDGFTRDHIALAGSKYGLTVLDISQLWLDGDFDGNTALVLAASQGSAIPSVEPERQGELILKEFAEFFPQFNPGAHWGDKNSDVDWEKTWLRTNLQYRLFLNDTGSWTARPHTLYEKELPRVVFAGDCVRTDVDMATVEGAIQGGTQAAAAIQAQDAALNGHARRGNAIRLVPHQVYSTAAFRGAQLLYLPVTYIAFAVAAYEQWKARMENGDPELGENEFTMAEYLVLVPTQFSIDWWKAAYWFVRALTGKDNHDPLEGRITYLPSPLGGSPGQEGTHEDENVSPDDNNDHIIGLGEAIVMVAREVYEYASGKEKTGRSANADDAAPDRIDAVIDVASKAIETAFRIGEGIAEGLARRRPQGNSNYRRRWRPKR